MAVVDRQEKQTRKTGSVLGAALIICGTCIGGGMLALPSATSAAGFLPSLASHVACWLFMLLTGLLLLEACLWLPEKDVHLPSLAHSFLGKPGKILTCGLFVFLYYCLLVSYLSGGAPYFSRFLQVVGAEAWGAQGPTGMILYIALLGAVLLLGNRVIDRVNLILVIGLFTSFAGLLVLGKDGVESANLWRQDWSQTLMATPVLFGAYGYHNVVPSLASYLEKDAVKLRRALVVGTALPLVVYCLWQAVALGIVDPAQLEAASQGPGIPIVEAMVKLSGQPVLASCVAFFSFFAIVTSILGVAFSMVDFLMDGAQWPRSLPYRFAATLATLVPPALVAAVRPNLFLEVFGYAAGYGEAILNGCIPVAIFWVGAKWQQRQVVCSPIKQTPWLLGLLAMAILVMAMETKHVFGF